MSNKSLIFVLEAHHPFISNTGTIGGVEENRFFDSLTYTYLPLLRIFKQLEADTVPFKLALVFSPVLCELMDNPYLQLRYVESLDKKIQFGQNELDRCENLLDKQKIIKEHINVFKQTRFEYVEMYRHNILEQFNYFAEQGYLEILATTATASFLPMYVDIPEAINAQIEIGLTAYRNYFTTAPCGFWLPAMAYTPGLEVNIKSYGFKYTILETHGVLFSTPPTDIFMPSFCSNGLSVFARDKDACIQVSGQKEGFFNDSAYLDTERDIGFELDQNHLKPLFDIKFGRRITGFRYWSRSDSPYGPQSLYDEKIATNTVTNHAQIFLNKRIDILNKAEKLSDGNAVHSLCAFPAHFFGCQWYEGVQWLDSLFRLATQNNEVSFSLPQISLAHHCVNLNDSDQEQKIKLKTIEPLHSSWLHSGYSEEVLNSANDWMYPYVRKALFRMIDLANRFPDDTGLKERSLNMAAREVLLAQSIEWFLGLNKIEEADYARTHFEDNINSFTVVFESLGSNFISTEWLTNTEKKHAIFDDINYRVFRQKQ